MQYQNMTPQPTAWKQGGHDADSGYPVRKRGG